jgi:hypothetical protein
MADEKTDSRPPNRTPAQADDRSSTSQKQTTNKGQGPRDRQIDPPAGNASNVEREREQD